MVVIVFVELHSVDLFESGLEFSGAHHRRFGKGVDRRKFVQLGVAKQFHDFFQGFHVLFLCVCPIDATGLGLGSFVDEGIKKFLDQQEEAVMKQQVMERGGGVGVQDLIKQGPVFEGDGFCIGVWGTARLVEEVAPDFFFQMVAKKSRGKKNGNFLYPGIAEVGRFAPVTGGGKAEGGMVGFQIELQQERRGGRWQADQGEVIAKGQVDDDPCDTGVKMAGARTGISSSLRRPPAQWRKSWSS